MGKLWMWLLWLGACAGAALFAATLIPAALFDDMPILAKIALGGFGTLCLGALIKFVPRFSSRDEISAEDESTYGIEPAQAPPRDRGFRHSAAARTIDSVVDKIAKLLLGLGLLGLGVGFTGIGIVEDEKLGDRLQALAIGLVFLVIAVIFAWAVIGKMIRGEDEDERVDPRVLADRFRDADDAIDVGD